MLAAVKQWDAHQGDSAGFGMRRVALNKVIEYLRRTAAVKPVRWSSLWKMVTDPLFDEKQQ